MRSQRLAPRSDTAPASSASPRACVLDPAGPALGDYGESGWVDVTSGGCANMLATMRLWHKHKWSEWDRAWGKGSAKSYVLERKCLICGKVETQVVR